MLAADTSSFIAYLQGADAVDVSLIEQALRDETLILPPMVVTELFSDHRMEDTLKALISGIFHLPLLPGFWERAGEVRAAILKSGKKARAMDAMIATYCVDHGVPLITRDVDYRHYVEQMGLQVLPIN